MADIKKEIDFSKFSAKSPESSTENPQSAEKNKPVVIDMTVDVDAERKKKILYIVAVLILAVGTFIVIFFFYRTPPPDTTATSAEIQQLIPNYKPLK